MLPVLTLTNVTIVTFARLSAILSSIIPLPYRSRNVKKVSATEVILRILQGGAEITADLFDTYFCGYNESYRKARGKMLGSIPRVTFEKDWGDLYHERQKFSKLLTALKSDGFIAKPVAGRNTPWTITKNGIKKLQRKQPAPYESVAAKLPTIVSYDIPERQKRERHWLRRVLGELRFTMVHRSVWIGNVLIPEQFLVELKFKGLMHYVHILEVSKNGTIPLSSEQ